MYGVKVLLNTFAILLVVCALVILWCEKPACGVFVAKSFATMFVIIAMLASRETSRLWLTIDIHKSYKRRFSIVRKSNMIMMMWRMNIWSIFGIKEIVCCRFRLKRRRIMMSKGNCPHTLTISPSLFSLLLTTSINNAFLFLLSSLILFTS